MNPTALYQSKHLAVHQRGRWQYVTRPNATGVIAIVAQHDDGRIVLIEQHRPPVNAQVIELPAGLVGDDGDPDEPLVRAAQRELEEETGYTARDWRQLTTASSSAGLTDEAVTFFLATGLTKTGPGGGITIDASGITLQASQIKLVGAVTMGGSGSTQVETLNMVAKEALPICEACTKEK